MASQHSKYDITLDKSLFVDPTFEKFKKFTEFFPLKYATINSRLFEKLSSSARVLLLQLLAKSYTEAARNFTITDKELLGYRGKSVDELFLELKDSRYLECPEIKENEIKERIQNKIKGTQKKTAKIVSSETTENPSDLSAQKTKLLIATYCEQFKLKYSTNPEIGGKDAGIAKRISKDWTEEKISVYTEAFFNMPDAELTKKRHPLFLFEIKKNEVTVFANSGKFVTNRQATQQDASNSNAILLQKVREGKL